MLWTGCDATQSSEPPPQPQAVALPAASPQGASEERTQEITFKAGTVIEVAYAAVKPGKESQLFEEYFPKAMPLAAKHGGKSLGSFQVVEVVEGTAQPQLVAFFEWDSVQSWLDLHADPEFQAVVPIRDDALSFIRSGNFYTVDQNTTVSVSDARVYQTWSAELAPGGDALIREYATKIESLASQAGKHSLVSLTPVPMSAGQTESVVDACDNTALPTTAGRFALSEWPSLESFKRFYGSEDMRTARALRDRATTSVSLLQTRFAFPPRT